MKTPNERAKKLFPRDHKGRLLDGVDESDVALAIDEAMHDVFDECWDIVTQHSDPADPYEIRSEIAQRRDEVLG